MQPYFDVISREDLQELLAGPGAVGISLYMPAVAGADGRQVREQSIRLKNLAAEAEDGLARYHRRDQALLAQIDWLRQLVDDEAFWRGQAQGLAIFLSSKFRKTFRLSTEPAEQVFVGGHFYLLPLVPSLTSSERFYVLGISRGTARLFAGDKASLRELAVEDMPASQADAIWFKESERSTRNNSAMAGRGGISGSSHGQGEDTRAPQADTEQYMREVDRAAIKAIDGQHGPLILAGSEPALGHYRRISNYPLLTKQAIEVKPEMAEPAELHSKALKIVEQEREDPAESLLHQYHWYQAHQPDRITSDPEALAEASTLGRIEHLLIASDVLQPQTAFGEQLPNQVEGAAIDNTDLLNLAATNTLGSSGHCVLVDRRLIAGAPAAAILRY
jgi:hypothetical protein